MVEIVDLPGIYDVHGFSDDERVVRQLLETLPVDLVAVVLNAVQVDRRLALAVQVARHGLPAVLLLTMLVIAVSLCSARLHANIDWVQAYSFMLLTLVHTPCLSTIATLRSESASNRYAIVSVTWGLVLAWGVSLAFYQAMRALGY